MTPSSVRSPSSVPPSSRRLPVAAFASVAEAATDHVVLHVFCPRDVAARPLEGCRDCPSCVAFESGEHDGDKPAVVCGW
jgi:hypothetical protein